MSLDEQLDQGKRFRRIIKRYKAGWQDVLEKDIEKSLREGKRDYYKPVAIKAMSAYEDPMRIQGIKASLIWNRIKDPDIEAIDLNARNTVDIVKVMITPSNISKIQDRFPDVYDRLVDLFMDNSIFKDDTNKAKIITTIAIPTGIEVPDWIKEFIDYKTIVNDNIYYLQI